MNAKYKSPRKSIPARIEKAVLAKSRRRCTLCFGLQNDRKEKLGQIAHLDGNRSNNAESNLAWMCLVHHSLFDSKTKQHKNYTISEVKEYRRRLYKALHPTSLRSSRRARRPHLSASKPKQMEGSAKVRNSPRCDFWLQFHPQGSRFLAIQNNGAEPAFDVVVYIADGSNFKSDVIHRLDNDRHWAACALNGNLISLESVRRVLVGTLLHPPDGGEVKAIPVLIRYRTHTQRSYTFHLEIRLPLQNGIQFALPEVVEKRANRANTPVEVEAAGISTSGLQDGGADADRKFARLAIEEARKSVAENDSRPHPLVGAVVVKDGKVLSTAHRGEQPGNHAEYVALEKKLSDEAVAGATVYATLEPCTTRNHPKIPCTDRLIERRIKRVVIGMLDPDERIRGKGQRKLTNAGIETVLFPHDLAMEVEELNREFTRFCERQTPNSLPTSDEDESNWPDVTLECEWPSLVHESRIPGSHIVRKRPWTLRHRGLGAVYNVRIHDIDFGEYKASFPDPVRTLTDVASVYPIICLKSEGRPDVAQVIATHDLESLIHNPPSGCDVGQYAVEIDGTEDEEQLEDFLAVEIPVTISYDDKNGNQFKIKYLLHYDIYMEKGEMIRTGRIEKVALK